MHPCDHRLRELHVGRGRDPRVARPLRSAAAAGHRIKATAGSTAPAAHDSGSRAKCPRNLTGMKVKSVHPNVEDMSADPVRHVVVVGGGMVAHRFVESLRSRDTAGTWRITVVSEEDALPYDRVALTSFFDGRGVEDLALGDTAMWDDPLVALVRGVRVESVDRSSRVVTTTDGQSIPYDHLVLATGSYPFVPPVQGTDLDGVFVYRTIEDVRAIQEFVQSLAPTLHTGSRRRGGRGSARPRGGRCSDHARGCHHRGGAFAAPDGPAGRSGWRRGPASPRHRHGRFGRHVG